MPQNSSYTVTYLPSLKPFKADQEDMQDAAGDVKMSSLATFSCGLLHTDVQVLGCPARTYLQQLCTDTGFSLEDLPNVMDDKDKWRGRVREIHACDMI